MTTRFRAGDVVRHRPSGEKWRVAYARDDRIAWDGWPPGTAAAEDCELVRAATYDEHVAKLREWAAKRDSCRRDLASDHRTTECARQLAHEGLE